MNNSNKNIILVVIGVFIVLIGAVVSFAVWNKPSETVDEVVDKLDVVEVSDDASEDEANGREEATLFKTGDSITIKRDGKVISVTGSEKTLYEGDHVITNSSGIGHIVFKDGSILALDNNSDILIESYREEDATFIVKIKQVFGKTWSKVIGIAGKETEYTVETSNTVASVRGTMFGCESDNDETTCYTEEGTVMLQLLNLDALANEILLVGGTQFTNSDEIIESIKTDEDLLALLTEFVQEDTPWFDYVNCLKEYGIAYCKGVYEDAVEAANEEEGLDLSETFSPYYGSPTPTPTPLPEKRKKRVIGGVYNDEGADVATDQNGNIFVTGYYGSGNVDFDDSAGGVDIQIVQENTDVFITKYYSDGSYAWTKTFGGSGVDKGAALDIDSSGNVYVTGSCTGMVDFNADPAAQALKDCNSNVGMFVTKYTNNGQYVWAGAIGSSGNSTNARDIIVNSNNGYIYVTGYFYGTVDFDWGAGTANVNAGATSGGILLKVDANGNYSKAIDFTVKGTDDYGAGLCSDNSGNVYITGTFKGGGHDEDLFVVKYDAGLTSRAFSYKVTRTGVDTGKSIVCDGGSNLYFTGAVEGFGFSPELHTENFSPAEAVYTDVYLESITTGGTYRWSTEFGGPLDDIGNKVILNAYGNVVVTGSFMGSDVSLGDGFSPAQAQVTISGLNTFNSNGGKDVFASEFETDGSYIKAKVFGGSGDDVGNSVSFYANETYIVGYFTSGSMNIDLLGGSYVVSTIGGKDVFLTYY